MSTASDARCILVVTHTWFPYYHGLLEALQEQVALPVAYVVLSATEPNRTWRLQGDSAISPVVISGRRIFLGSHAVILSPWVGRYFRGLRPAVVVTEGWGDPGYLAVHRYARRMGAPVVTWMCGRDPRMTRRLAGRLVRALSSAVARRVIRASRRVFVYGSRARRDAIALGARDPDIVIVRQTIEEEHFDADRWRLAPAAREAARRQLGLDGRPVLLCVSQLIPRKGIGDLLEAFVALRQRTTGFQLLLVGMGSLARAVKAFAAGQRDGFVWLPGVEYAEIPRIYALADCFVFPTHFDAWGNVVNESHCAKLPIVCSDGAQAAEDLIRDGETGLVYTAGDVATLVDRMDFALRHPEVVKRMAEAGYRFIRTEWNRHASARIWKQQIEEIVA